MVCLGNICRSPLAHAILEDKIKKLGLDWEVDSAGTGDWHKGELPDQRSINIGLKYNLDLTNQRARQISQNDFDAYDYILVMDKSNLNDVLGIQPNESHAKIEMIMNYCSSNENVNVPDPYYDGRFELVYSMLLEGIDAFVEAHTGKI
jgi:protein-tyrosine phosphatase